ncbi:hypothetical protein PENTCL1PPCAC_2125 [Pristionchus entomophagus]|uniref:Uncharacterized protein n=1 Tax=Pristionchus entomophagus TaxID=358040 RepID=A0AAV5SIF8_9BILA|nr:hypothetical protein PENTCL1PPCAC_2125 [Pristionchus entomophagus]
MEGATEPEEVRPKLTRVSSNRFQVSRTDDDEDLTLSVNDSQPLRVKSVSEPPQPMLSVNNHNGEAPRKLSGRFTVETQQQESSPLAEEKDPEKHHELTNKEMYIEDPEEIANSVQSAQKTVQFTLADRDSEQRRSSDMEGNATINLKSWRNMKTLEHPPIIDFYRQSIDQDGIVNSRPSMSQLIHGQKSIPEEEMEFENFEVHEMDHNGHSKSGDLKDAHGFKGSSEEQSERVEKFEAPTSQAGRVKFGWFKGVFVRCLLNIFGVMLYMRISWVTGQAGILFGCGIVLLASLTTIITTLSTCAICTNGDVKGGGAYFLISRSLGPEFGGSIGLIFCVANAVGAAMYVVGFSETVRDILKAYDLLPFDEMNTIRLIGIVTCLIILVVVFIGPEFESKMQMGLLVILCLSIINYFIGAFIPPNETMTNRGMTGYSFQTLQSNLLPRWRNGESFFSVFAVYFPAATGIMAGANISGDLADPQHSIPLGTLLAILVTTVIYLLVVITTGSIAVADSDGIIPAIFNDTTGYFVPPACSFETEEGKMCEYGLINYFQIVEAASLWGPLIIAGIFAATLSSALASLVSAPKVFQAMCKDKLFPRIDYFAKGYGANEEPRRAYLLAGGMALVMVLIGDLNAIAPIISNFFLASYALINYACFDQSFSDSPGFRPSFKYYNMWVSAAGSALCFCVMFIISWETALLTFLFFAVIFIYLTYRKPDVNWGSSTQAHSYKNALASMVKLANTEEHVKTYRPQILVLSGNPAARPSLVDFVYNITKGTSLMICGYVVPYAPSDRVYSVCRKLDRQLNEWLQRRKIKSFYASVANQSIRAGAQSLLQITGLGRLRPNIVIIGFKTNWCDGGPSEARLKEINDYFGVIQDAFDNGMGVGVLRNEFSGLDYSEAMKRYNVCEGNKQLHIPDVRGVSSSLCAADAKDVDEKKALIEKEEKEDDSNNEAKEVLDASSASTSFADFPFAFELSDEEGEDAIESEEGEEEENEEVEVPASVDIEKGRPSLMRNTAFALSRRRRKRKQKNRRDLDENDSRRPTQEQKALLNSISKFQRKIKRGVIDVWWLYDDGGLTLLIPHLLTIPKSYLEGSKLRVFTISTSSRTMEQEQRGMVALLSKFRIDFSDVFVIADVGKKPNQRTLDAFNELIQPYRGEDGESNGLITDSELSAQREKTYRQLRIGELLKEHSSDADLVVVTLPVPRKGLVSSCLYLAWLDMMTRHLPPTLLIRGNQTSVLTFYS